MKKKVLSLAVISIVCVMLSSCGESNSATSDSASKKPEESTTLSSTTVLSTTIPPTTAPPTTVHTHQWEDMTSSIHHDAVREQVWVVDKPASSSMEYHFNAFCTYCNSKWSYDSATDTLPIERLHDAMYAHRDECERKWKAAHGITLYDDNGVDWSTIPSIVYTLAESYEYKTPEEGHYENQLTKEAYDETIITGQRCKTCGEYRAVETKNN